MLYGSHLVYKTIIDKQNIKNSVAGSDFIAASFILICIKIDPESKAPSIEAAKISRFTDVAKISRFGYIIDVNNTKAKPTFKNPTIYSKPLVILAKGRLCLISKCEKEWCKIKVDKFKGWVKKESLWGRL